MKLIAKKVCSFGGKKFYINDEIPAEYVLDTEIQVKRGVIVVIPDGEAEAQQQEPPAPVILPISVVLHTEDGDVELNPTSKGLQAVFDVLTSTVDNAEPIVKNMTEDVALRLVFMADSRKSIQNAAKARANELLEEAGEQ